MNVWIVNIEYSGWGSSMIYGVYSTLEKAKESITDKRNALNGIIVAVYNDGMTYHIAHDEEFGGSEIVSFNINRHTVN